MLQYLQYYNGPLTVNGQSFNTTSEAIEAFGDFNGELVVTINHQLATGAKKQRRKQHTEHSKPNNTDVYQIKVKKYMTMPSTADFDFQKKWNNNEPMPMRIMCGVILKETKGMYKMEMWAEITQEQTQQCMKCGRPLTNPVSKYFGIGPECGGHNYTHPFSSDAELKAEVKKYNNELKVNTSWTGWVIKSAILEKEQIR